MNPVKTAKKIQIIIVGMVWAACAGLLIAEFPRLQERLAPSEIKIANDASSVPSGSSAPTSPAAKIEPPPASVQIQAPPPPAQPPQRVEPPRLPQMAQQPHCPILNGIIVCGRDSSQPPPIWFGPERGGKFNRGRS